MLSLILKISNAKEQDHRHRELSGNCQGNGLEVGGKVKMGKRVFIGTGILSAGEERGTALAQPFRETANPVMDAVLE